MAGDLAVMGVRQLIMELRERFGRSLALEFRMGAAFFKQNLLKLLARLGCFYAVKVPFCKWTGVKALIAAQPHWSTVTDIECFEVQFGDELLSYELVDHFLGKAKSLRHFRTSERY